MADQEMAWRELRFHMKMDLDWENTEPIQLLIANDILRPSIEQYEVEMRLWRIHRMYGDPHGTHRVMFKFFGPESTGSLIKSQVESHESLCGLKHHEGLRLEGFVTKGQKIEDDCDPNWPDEIKGVWPYYICGASKAWLKLVEIIARKRTDLHPGVSYEDRKQVYKTIRDEVDRNWVDYGGHAMIHHLNAIFGYKYVKVSCPDGFIKTLQQVTQESGNRKVPVIFAEMRF